MTVTAFTWQRYHKPLNETALEWRRLEKITMAAEAAAKHPYAGMSILDVLWEELDTIMDQLMEEGAPEKSSLAKAVMSGSHTIAQASEEADMWYNTLKEWGELRGQAQGVAFAIALVQNPYAADVPAVKAEAKRRWDIRQD